MKRYSKKQIREIRKIIIAARAAGKDVDGQAFCLNQENQRTATGREFNKSALNNFITTHGLRMGSKKAPKPALRARTPHPHYLSRVTVESILTDPALSDSARVKMLTAYAEI